METNTTNWGIVDNMLFNHFISVMKSFTLKSNDNNEFLLNKDDLLPQATFFAQIILSEILKTGRIEFEIVRKLSNEYCVSTESVLLRLPMLQINNDNSEVSLVLKQEIFINPKSPNLITIPCPLKDALLNVRDRSKDLYLIISSIPAKHIRMQIYAPEIADQYYSKFCDFRLPVEIRLVLLTQAIFFTNNEGLEKFRHDAMTILLEYHRDVNPISEYFQSFTREPMISGREIK